MSQITPQWAKVNPFEAAARLNELERENAVLRADKERLEYLTESLDRDWIGVGGCIPTDQDLECPNRLDAWRISIDAARKEAQP